MWRAVQQHQACGGMSVMLGWAEELAFHAMVILAHEADRAIGER